ncbi:hypothetical protein PPYR_09936 [Photinus pyralis]|uniref:DUF243 domain-containing protein n=1 Tax=Photinus pyralis TaxID=7054 RepID=A0A5N4AEW3_PHOPY|nr:uncharacterized protein LOC116174755 [Photinus pyralis]KAB0795875.1 hypothetical protein PPYR_09936 [Photinus pyralis]
MKFCLLVTLVIGTCLARPDVSHLPNVYLPSQTANVRNPVLDTRADGGGPGVVLVTPKGDGGISDSIFSIGGEGSTTPVPEYNLDNSGTGFSQSIFNIGPSSPAPSASSGGDLSGSAAVPQGASRLPTGSYLPDSGIKVIGSESSGGDGSYIGLPGSGGGQQAGSDRSVYFFAIPDDETQSRLRINILPSTHSSNRVIFIKAPSYAPPIPEVISAPSTSDEKTVIYVLSKKPQPASPISIPASAIVKQTKPQIFFIKYGSRAEAENAIASGLKGNLVGGGLQDLQNEQSFIKAIQEMKGGIKGTFGPAGQSGPYF